MLVGSNLFSWEYPICTAFPLLSRLSLPVGLSRVVMVELPLSRIAVAIWVAARVGRSRSKSSGWADLLLILFTASMKDSMDL